MDQSGGQQKPWISQNFLLALAFLLLAATYVFHLASAAKGRSIYRDQHIGPALIYATNGVDLLRPVIVGFNASNTPTPQEFPLWQAQAGLAFRWLGPWFGWANLVSLVWMTGALFPLYGLARQFLGTRGAAWTLVFFVSQPLVFLYAGEASTDGFSIVAAIWFLYFAVRMLEGGSAACWAGAAAAGALTALSKLPFFMATGLACFLWLLLQHRKSPRAWLLLGSAGAVAAATFFGWTHYTDHCNAIAVYPHVDLRASDPEQANWYFGDWKYRLDPRNYIKGGWRVLNACFGSFALVGIFLYGLFYGKGAFGKLLLLGGLATTFVFTHLVLHHHHYYLMFAPAFALICAQTALAGESRLKFATSRQSCAFFGIIGLVLALSLVQGLVGLKIILNYDSYPYQMAKIMAANSTATDKLLVSGGGWGGNELMLAHRQGLSIWTNQFLDSPADLARLKQMGFNKLVMLSDAPLLWALQKINPGETYLERRSYTNWVTPAIKDWPVLYQSEDILIKQLP